MKKIYFSKATVKSKIKNALWVALGAVILAFGASVFFVPFNIVAGGATGLAIGITNLVPWEFFTVDLCVTILTWLFFFLGWIFFGTEFALKTLISSIIYPIAFSIFGKLPSENVLGGFFNLAASEQYGSIAVLVSSLFGGAFIGAGCAFTFRGGGSTGGTDVIALLICKFFKKLRSSYMVFVVDASVIIFGMIAVGDFVITLVGILAAFVAAIVIDKLMLMLQSKAYIANIVSDKYQEINDAIIHNLNRTSTILEAKGGYTGESKKMVMVSFTVRQYAAFIALVSSIDKDAFVTIHLAHEINGEGWTKYDHKKKED
ncbi:MAG: YitT family protein [Clostridia bacterium]|nr:YitT family protein [Clostridia bacterium]